MNKNKLAVAVNLLGGFDQLADILGVDEDLIEKAVSGFTLGSNQEYDLDTAWKDAIKEQLIDRDEIDKYTDIAENATLRNSADIKNGMRLAIANGQVDLEQLQDEIVLKNLTDHQFEMIIEWLGEDIDNTLSDFLDVDFSWDVPESEFWKLFREIFYRE